MFTEPELAERRPVWAALSELFLDVEPTDDGRRDVARALAASPYALEDLERILRREVFPVLWRNLFLVAGVWDGFDLERLEREIVRRRRRRWRWPFRPGWRMIEREWRELRRAVEAERREGGVSA
ncbi:MAG: hypothetical protein ACF8XB_17055 [Planctomycetota bacterium JB042]